MRMLDQCFDANSPFSAIMLLVKAGCVSADSISLQSSLQAMADYNTEACLGPDMHNLLSPSAMFKDLDSRLRYVHLEPDNSALVLHDRAWVPL